MYIQVRTEKTETKTETGQTSHCTREPLYLASLDVSDVDTLILVERNGLLLVDHLQFY